MPEEFSPDQPVDREAVVSSYSPEMVGTRDVLVGRLQGLREQFTAEDAAGTLPPRLGVHTYENGVTVLDLGRFAEDYSEALAQHRTDVVLSVMALDLEGVGMPGSELMTIMFYDRQSPQTAEDPSLPTIEQPMIKVEWGDQNGDERVSNCLSIYSDGYVETASEITRTKYVHPPDASDFERANMRPTVPQEVSVLPPITQPAELADIQNTAAQVEGTLVRYGYGQE
jgi:hypothetical protein